MAGFPAAQNDSLASGRVYLQGECTYDRRLLADSGLGPLSGQLNIVGIVAARSETITHIASMTNGTAAGATPTLCQMAIYQFDAFGNATLLASCANDTTLWAGTFTRYVRALTTPFNKVQGVNYGLGILCISAAAMPTFYVNANNGGVVGAGTILSTPPVMANAETGLAALPASIPVGSFNSVGQELFMEILP